MNAERETAWDLRAFKKPVATRSGLATLYPGTNAIFSPDEKYIVTGSGATTKGGTGKLHFLKREYETLFVHRFSNGTMPLYGLFRK